MIAELLLRVQDVADRAVERVLVHHEGRPAQERIAVRPRVAIIPVPVGRVQACRGVDGGQRLLVQPALDLAQRITGNLGRPGRLFENRLVDGWLRRLSGCANGQHHRANCERGFHHRDTEDTEKS